MVTIFAGGNDANTIGQVIQGQQSGDDIRGFIDQQVRQFGDDIAALIRAVRQKAPGAKVVLLNLPNLGAAPYMSRSPALDRGIMQRIHDRCIQFGTESDGSVNYVVGANRAGFAKVADAMLASGLY